MHIGMAGAGLSCAVIGRELAAAGHRVEIFESRGHVGGNCHTQRDAENGILVHECGPHLFHTDDDAVWAYVNRFASFRPYMHRVMAVARRHFRHHSSHVRPHLLHDLRTRRQGQVRADQTEVAIG